MAMWTKEVVWKTLNAMVAPGDIPAEVPRGPGILVLILTTALCVSCAWTFWNSDVGYSILRKTQEDTLSRFQSRLAPERYRQMLEHAAIAPDAMAAGEIYKAGARIGLYSLVVSVILVPVAGIAFLRLNVTWLRNLAIMGYCSPILFLRELMILALSYAHGTPLEAAGVSPLLGGSGDCCGTTRPLSFTAAFLINADPFITWWCVVMALVIGRAYFGGRWKRCVIVLLTLQLMVTTFNGYATMTVSRAVAYGQPVHGRR